MDRLAAVEGNSCEGDFDGCREARRRSYFDFAFYSGLLFCTLVPGLVFEMLRMAMVERFGRAGSDGGILTKVAEMPG